MPILEIRVRRGLLTNKTKEDKICWLNCSRLVDSVSRGERKLFTKARYVSNIIQDRVCPTASLQTARPPSRMRFVATTLSNASTGRFSRLESRQQRAPSPTPPTVTRKQLESIWAGTVNSVSSRATTAIRPLTSATTPTSSGGESTSSRPNTPLKTSSSAFGN